MLVDVVRVLAVFTPGYLHPDEFFQSQEVVASWVLGDASALVPWEFDCSLQGTLFRSVVPPYVQCRSDPVALPTTLSPPDSSLTRH